MDDKQVQKILADLEKEESFDIDKELDLDPSTPGYEVTKLQLTLQMLIFTLTRLIADRPELRDAIETYNQDFIEKVKHGD